MGLKLTGLLLAGLVATGGALWALQDAAEPAPAQLAAAACVVPALASEHPGMVWLDAGTFTMGAENTYPEEGPVHAETVSGFWIDQAEVTNAQFAQFVAATGYVTLAERGIEDPAAPDAAPLAGSAVFQPQFREDGQLDPFRSWWQFVAGADWRHPQGPDSSLEGLEQHPVVHVAYEDALAYAQWQGHSLPTEAQFEFAAQASARRDMEGTYTANTWQGFFPFQNDASDGHTGTAPVGCYTANPQGLYDLIGNVWEWTASPYYASHDFAAKDAWPEGYDPAQPDDAVAVIKGGSFLCAPNYCMRYRPEARQGQSKGLGTSHIGFRTVLNP